MTLAMMWFCLVRHLTLRKIQTVSPHKLGFCTSSFAVFVHDKARVGASGSFVIYVRDVAV